MTDYFHVPKHRGPKPPSLQERFELSHTKEPNSGCWLWVGSVRQDGHGAIGDKRRVYLAHRVSWEMHRGAIPDGMLVLHKCNVACCVNPSHLYLGTHADNMKDRDVCGRTPRGEKSGMAKLTEDAVRDIRLKREPWKASARKYGVGKSTILSVRNGSAWRHVQ